MILVLCIYAAHLLFVYFCVMFFLYCKLKYADNFKQQHIHTGIMGTCLCNNTNTYFFFAFFLLFFFYFFLGTQKALFYGQVKKKLYVSVAAQW